MVSENTFFYKYAKLPEQSNGISALLWVIQFQIKRIVGTSELFCHGISGYSVSNIWSLSPLLTSSVEPRVFGVSHNCLECLSYIEDKLLTEAPFKNFRNYLNSRDRKQELLFCNVMCDRLDVTLSGQVAQNWLNCPNGDINKALSSLPPQFA